MSSRNVMEKANRAERIVVQILMAVKKNPIKRKLKQQTERNDFT